MTTDLDLELRDLAALEGERGPGVALAMRIVTRMARATGARSLRDVTAAHIDGCLYHGRAGLDLVERLAGGGARVAIPTTLNVGSLDLLHPGLFRGDAGTAELGHRLMDRYVELGCRPTWTCAPYQLPRRPGLGEQIAWAESNAIVFANSVLGARTNRYGDFIDIAAAVTGRVPDVGLHRDEGRRAELVVRVHGVPADLLADELTCAVLGLVLGHVAGTRVAAVVGMHPGTGEDALKAMCAAAASSGAVALFHAVGVTPEAPTLEAVADLGLPTVDVGPDDLRRARAELSTTASDELGAVSIGTPHFSVAEFERLIPMLPDRPFRVPFYVSTGRDVLDDVARRGWLDRLAAVGITIVTDTCTYVTPILRRPVGGAVMTDSAKWAWYAPGNIGVDVVFGSLAECVESAARGRVLVDARGWLHA